MTIVKINNPYFDKSYKVVEDKGDIEYTLKTMTEKNQGFLHFHDYETGDPITISPACCASVEFTAGSEDT